MSLRSLRACLVCSYVQTGSKFNSEGCPNCEDFLEMRGSSDAVQECTSQVFEGMMTLNNTAKDGTSRNSWVARWQRLDTYQPGVYAVKVVGVVSRSKGRVCARKQELMLVQLPEDYVAAAENAGVKYIPYVACFDTMRSSTDSRQTRWDRPRGVLGRFGLVRLRALQRVGSLGAGAKDCASRTSRAGMTDHTKYSNRPRAISKCHMPAPLSYRCEFCLRLEFLSQPQFSSKRERVTQHTFLDKTTDEGLPLT